jgi:hypothetical protein
MRASEESIKAHLRQLLHKDNNWPMDVAAQLPDLFLEHESTVPKPRAKNYPNLTPMNDPYVASNPIQNFAESNDQTSIDENTHGSTNLLGKAEVRGNASGPIKLAASSHVNGVMVHDEDNDQFYVHPTRKFPTASTTSAEKSTPNELLGNTGRVNRQSGTVPAASPSLGNSVLPPQPLLQLVSRIIRTQGEKVCTLLPDDERQSGKYPCSFGCGHAFRNAADLFRHQAILFPQDFWFCAHCGNPERPHAKHIFTRKDKFLKHLKSNHPEVDIGTISQSKVRGVKPMFPKKCELCLHHHHTSWEDRRKHIMIHCNKRAFLNIPSRRPPSRRELPMGDDQGGNDDDNDDSGDDNDDQNGPADDPGNKADGYADNGSSDDPPNGEPENSHDHNFDFGSASDVPFDFDPWFSFESMSYPTSIKLQRLLDESREASNQTDPYPIRWLGRVNGKGATAAVHKVALPIDLDTGKKVSRKYYAVKQYVLCDTANYSRFQQEVEAYTFLERHAHSSFTSIIRCYGTFEYTGNRGRLTRNLLLEYGECDLREYRADTPIPRDTKDIVSLWWSLCNVTRAIRSIQTLEGDDGQRIRGTHGDVKPDNILRFGDTFKLTDLGFAHFAADVQESNIKQECMEDVTKPYESVPAQSNCDLGTSQAAKDIWDFGHVLVSTITWAVLGFSNMQQLEQQTSVSRSNADTDVSAINLAIDSLRIAMKSNSDHCQAYTARMLDFAEQMLDSDQSQRFTALDLFCAFGETLQSTSFSPSVPWSRYLSSPEDDRAVYPQGPASGPGGAVHEQSHEQDISKAVPVSLTLDCPIYQWQINSHESLFNALSWASAGSRDIVLLLLAPLADEEWTRPPKYHSPFLERQPACRKRNVMQHTGSNSLNEALSSNSRKKSSSTLPRSGSLPRSYSQRSTSNKFLCKTCGSSFKGRYLQGSLARHTKLVHGSDFLIRQRQVKRYSIGGSYSRFQSAQNPGETHTPRQKKREEWQEHRIAESRVKRQEDKDGRARADISTIRQPLSVLQTNTWSPHYTPLNRTPSHSDASDTYDDEKCLVDNSKRSSMRHCSQLTDSRPISIREITLESRYRTYGSDTPSFVPKSDLSEHLSKHVVMDELARTYTRTPAFCIDLSHQPPQHQSSCSRPGAALNRGHIQCQCSPRRRRSCAVTIDSNRQKQPSSYDCCEGLSDQYGRSNEAPTATRQWMYPNTISIPHPDADGRPPIYAGRHMSMDSAVVYYQRFVLFLASSFAHPLTLCSQYCSIEYCSIEHTPRHDNHLNNPRDVVSEQDLIEHIAQAMEQYLTGRQEKLWVLHIPISCHSRPETYRMLRRLFSEFWHSPRRQPFRRGFHIRFIEMQGAAQFEQSQEHSLQQVRALTDQFQ